MFCLWDFRWNEKWRLVTASFEGWNFPESWNSNIFNLWVWLMFILTKSKSFKLKKVITSQQFQQKRKGEREGQWGRTFGNYGINWGYNSQVSLCFENIGTTIERLFELLGKIQQRKVLDTLNSQSTLQRIQISRPHSLLDFFWSSNQPFLFTDIIWLFEAEEIGLYYTLGKRYYLF